MPREGSGLSKVAQLLSGRVPHLAHALYQSHPPSRRESTSSHNWWFQHLGFIAMLVRCVHLLLS